MKRLPLPTIELTDSIDVYSFDAMTKVIVKGKYGTAFLSILPGMWRIREMKKTLSRWQKVKKFFRCHKDQYFIRAQRFR